MGRGMPKRAEPTGSAPSPPEPPEDRAAPARGPVPRLVQRSGPSTLVVSLPKAWVEKEGVRPGQAISWVTGEDGELRLVPPERRSRNAEPRTFQVRAHHLVQREIAQRLLLSAYVLGYDRIRIEDGQGIDEEIRAAAEQTARELLGFTLTEATPHFLVATSFLDPAAHPVAEVLTRVGYTLDLFLERLETAFAEGSSKALQRIPEMRIEVRRLHALALRQLNLAVGDPRLARQLGVLRPSHLLGSRVVAKLLDDIADAGEAVAGELSRLRKPPATAREVLTDLKERVAALRTMLRTALGALRSESTLEAEEALAHRQEAIEDLLRTEARLRRMPGRGDVRHSLSLCSWWVGVARQHAMTIAEIAFTRSLARSPPVLDLGRARERD